MSPKIFSGSGQPLEIERKYLIRRPNEEELRMVPGIRVLQMEQVYLLSADGERSRIRRIEEGGRLSFFHTKKRDVTSVTRIEVEREISEDEYQMLLASADPARHPICKTRFCLPYGDRVFEIDLFPGWKDTALMEVELGSELETIAFPPQIEILKEVTEDLSFRNSSLALNTSILTAGRE